MAQTVRVLFIEDSDDDTSLQVRLLEQAGYQVEYLRVAAAKDLVKALNERWDLLISDYSMPHFAGSDALKIVRNQDKDIPFIFVSGTTGEDTAVAALKFGAQDYLMKTNLGRLVPAVQRELRDAGERKQQRSLQGQAHQLQRFEAIGRLASGVAHDFNNMIGAIMGWAEMGLEDSESSTRAQDRFQKIHAQAERAANLTRQLLAFARRQILQTCNTDLNSTVLESAALLRNTISERIEIDLQLTPELCVAWADPSQVEQILMNLCLNARDAMPDGGKLSIETRNVQIEGDYIRAHPWAVAGTYVRLRVFDAGTGMDPAVLEHIFEPFFTTKEMGKGTGLGLATVYGIVKQHKGFIDVESTPGQGTTFSVYLPTGNGVPKAPDKFSGVAPRGMKERILFAEDNKALREVTGEFLQKVGYDVLMAEDGLEAVRLFVRNLTSVDLLLLDVVMPGLNGPEAFARMNNLRPEIPVIFTTGYATEVSLIGAELQGQPTILQKPYATLVLAQKVRRVLDETKGQTFRRDGRRDSSELAG